MKSKRPFEKRRFRRRGVALLGVGMAVSTASAADTNAPPAAIPPPMTPQEMFEGGKEPLNNWVEFSTGGFITSGNKAQFEQMHRSPAGPFGGIEDLHYQHDLDKSTTLTLDGRALFDEHDYKFNLGVTREKLGFLRLSFSEFRTWYNGNGGFYPPTGMNFPMSADALALDRGQFSVEGGLRMEGVPNVTFKYTHTFRDGEQGSTEWGYSHFAGGQGLSPSFRDIDEHTDAFELDATHHIKSTDLGLGVRYETGKLDDALKITQYPGESVQQDITDRAGTTYDLFNVHAFTETWIRKNLLLSSGYSFSDMNSDFTGSRIYGSAFDVGYVPSAAQSGLGYYGLNGGSRVREYVMDLNLLWKPTAHFSIVPSLRVQKEDQDASFSGNETLHDLAAAPFNGNSDGTILDVSERLDLRYTGVTNWVFTVRGDWTEGDGNVNENGGLVQMNYLGTPVGVPPTQSETDDRRFFQKYSIEARWYPARRVTVDAGGYYKINRYDYNNTLDSTPNTANSPNRYPAYLVLQDFDTSDGNMGLPLRPLQNITLVSRYEYQVSTIHTKPDPVSGLGDSESSRMMSHILAQNISWSPWSRLSLQVGFNYVLSTTRTPASDYTQAILPARNDYWTLTFSSGLVLDDKTDLNLSYFFYQANDYSNNSPAGVPYGAGGEEHGITAAIVRRINPHLRLSLKAGYYRYQDQPSGGNNNYEAYGVSSSLQYRF